jgi:phosphoadenosine phosphosulfate reductase
MTTGDTLTLIAQELDRAGTPCVTSSFQAECVVLVHMLRQYRPNIPVLFLDTVHHFDETYRYRDEIADACGRHKVDPLFAALRHYDTWFTGLRRDQSASRAGLQEVEPFSVGEDATLRKISPLAGWTTADVRDYAQAHAIPLLPLYERGYTSIGCEPCTSLPLDPGNERSGRWAGEKLECGIHLRR